MREIARLEPAPIETSGTAERAWGWQHGMMVLGVSLVVIAVVGSALAFWHRPIAPIDAIDPASIQQRADDLTPLQTLHIWRLMKQGLDRRVNQRYADLLSLYHAWLGFAAVAGLLGIALVGGSIAVGNRRQSRTPAADG